MASTLKPHTPIYDDQLVAWHNQRLWWLLCGAGGVIAALTIAICVLLLRPHTQPWVIEVNGKGEPVAGVTPLLGSANISDTTIRWAIGEYIQNVFRVSSNYQEEQTSLSRAYAMSSQQASQMLTSYYHANKDANNPLMVNGKFWQEVRVIDTLKLAPTDTYQIDYVVDRHDREHLTHPVATNWRATMRVLHGKPTDNNPLGLFITDLDFEPEAK
jgi:type IV secretory pathway TrbF-like protein